MADAYNLCSDKPCKGRTRLCWTWCPCITGILPPHLFLHMRWSCFEFCFSSIVDVIMRFRRAVWKFYEPRESLHLQQRNMVRRISCHVQSHWLLMYTVTCHDNPFIVDERMEIHRIQPRDSELHRACYKQPIENIIQLLNEGADVNSRGASDRTALHRCISVFTGVTTKFCAERSFPCI